MITLSDPTADSRFEEGEVTLRHIFTGARQVVRDVALFTYATSRAADNAMAEPLRVAGLEVHQIGDCFAPRLPLNATAEGHRVGNAL